MAPNVARRTGGGTQRDLVALDHPSVARPQSHARVQNLRTDVGRSSTQGSRPIREAGRDRDDGLDAARRIAFGVALGTICWLHLGVVVYLIAR